jgi:glutamate-1-semialdehyde 2,1-aminomutase
MEFKNSLLLNERLHQLIPGGAHTYAKGDDQFPPGCYPVMIKGKGCHVWDADGNEYIEYGMGLRSVTLGHAYEPVVEAAYKQMLLGTNFGRPAAIELDCAEKFLEIAPGMEMVKFAKNGSDVTTAAIKLARAYTGRPLIAICKDHPFFSVDDWFIGSTPMDAGIPNTIKELTVTFQYNNLDSVRNLFEKYPGQIAGLILEAEERTLPENNFLQHLKEICHANEAVLIFDEIKTGFRLHLGGAQQLHNVEPDLCTFGKAMGNGFSISALAGKKELMELGGLRHKKERVFLLSTTFGAEYHALAAAIATIKIYQQENVIDFLYQQGQRLADGINRSIAETGMDNYFGVMGRASNLVYYTLDQQGKPSQLFRTLFLQETMKRGLLLPSLIVSYSHTDKDIDQTIEIIHEALIIYKKALSEGIEKYLTGQSVQPVFRKMN